MASDEKTEERDMAYFMTIANPLIGAIVKEHKGEWDWTDMMMWWGGIGHCIVMHLSDEELPPKRIIDEMVNIFSGNRSQPSDGDDDNDLFRAYV